MDPSATRLVGRTGVAVTQLGLGRASYAELFYKVPEVIEFLSGYMTLLPGDIISMGTALKASSNGGSAVQNINLAKSGTRVSVSRERIGTLENTSLLTG